MSDAFSGALFRVLIWLTSIRAALGQSRRALSRMDCSSFKRASDLTGLGAAHKRHPTKNEINIFFTLFTLGQ
jgi:hypothetical protein